MLRTWFSPSSARSTVRRRSPRSGGRGPRAAAPAARARSAGWRRRPWRAGGTRRARARRATARTPARRPRRRRARHGLVDRCGLQQVAGGTGSDGVEQVALGLADGEDHDRADRRALLARRQPTASRHVQVAHDEVGLPGVDDIDGAFGVVGLADHVECRVRARPAPRPHEGVVVGEHDPDDRGGSPVVSTRSTVGPRCRAGRSCAPRPAADIRHAGDDRVGDPCRRDRGGSNPAPSSRTARTAGPGRSVSANTMMAGRRVPGRSRRPRRPHGRSASCSLGRTRQPSSMTFTGP